MEVPYESEDEQVQDLQTRHRLASNYVDSSSSDSTDFTDGEKMEQIIEGTSVIEQPLSQSQEDGANFDINVAHNEESNGFTKEQNGDDGVVYPTLPEINGGDEETDIGAITSSFSKTPETAAGLKYVESLFNESSNGVNGMPSDVYNSENIVNKSLILSGRNEIVEAGGSQEVELGVDEFDVERVIHNQESHDLICPHCNRNITKRVILKRRKRKIEHISGGAEDIRIKPGSTEQSIAPGEDLDINKEKQEKEPHVKRTSEGCIDAISCFSCFSIFVPKEDGFLWWRFTPKPAVTSQTDDPSAVNIVSSESTREYQTETEKPFPFWILTCCQPYHTEKPVLKPDSKPPLTLEDGKTTRPDDSELPSSSSQDIQESSRSQSSTVPGMDSELPPSTEPSEGTLLPPTPEFSVTPDKDEDSSPMWFLSCCQPSENRTKTEHVPNPDKPLDSTYQPPTLLDHDTLSVPKRLTPIKPVEETMLPPEEKPLVTPTEDKDSSLWFLTCCQPASEGKRYKHPKKPDLLATSSQSERPPPPSKDESLTSTHASTTPDHASTISSKTSTFTKPATETSIPHETQPLVTPAGDAGTAFPFWFVTCCQPSTDGNEPKPATKQDPAKKAVVSPEVETQVESEDGTEIQRHEKIVPSAQSDGTAIQYRDTEPPSIDSSDMSVPPMSEPPNVSETWQTIQPKPLPLIKPKKDIPSPSEPEAPPTPPKGEIILHMPEEQPIPEPLVTSYDTYGTGHTPSIEQPLLDHQPEIASAGVSGMDIIKAIVYGGLLECITSLSVITSAAGGDATTLNIVALGLANVFGGLVLLFHNLRVLKHEQTTDRYEDQLGRPGHFLLHAVVAVLSYLIFGLMSPIIYGFAFRKSDNKDYKLATLAAASLLCIAILSIGKAYVRRPPKPYLETFFYYISMAIMVSGIGYVAGDLINMLLKKLGVFDSQTAPVAMGEAWAAY